MLALRIIATVFMGLSVISMIMKNFNIWDKNPEAAAGVTVYGTLWRAFVIVALWLI